MFLIKIHFARSIFAKLLAVKSDQNDNKAYEMIGSNIIQKKFKLPENDNLATLGAKHSDVTILSICRSSYHIEYWAMHKKIIAKLAQKKISVDSVKCFTEVNKDIVRMST
ncbi:hypothetical protein GJ496_001148 [Pomphorhynchus laevis]|nr:hypothetical protein GJ496_001148 [Pomphorhynchus laevis]